MSDIQQQEFTQHLNSQFSVTGEPPVNLNLEEIYHPKAPEGYECFSLVFSAKGPCLEQATYRIQHPELNDMDLFLVPIDQKGDIVYYESVFNRRMED